MFKKPKIAVRLDIPKSSLPVGSNMETTITVSSNEEFDATEIRAELRCVERVRRERWVYNPRSKRQIRTEYWDTATLLAEDLKASGSLHIVPGFKKKFPIKVTIPASGRETRDGIDANVSWFIKGVVAVDGRPDATSKTIELQIFRAAGGSVKEEIEMVPCEYCRSLMPENSSSCPICGAPRRS